MNSDELELELELEHEEDDDEEEEQEHEVQEHAEAQRLKHAEAKGHAEHGSNSGHIHETKQCILKTGHARRTSASTCTT